jgi:hypothetical protein
VGDVLNLEFWVFITLMSGIFAIFALGLQLHFGFTGLLNFGHVAFMAISAYAMAILVVKLGWPLWVASISALVTTGVAAVLIGLTVGRLRSDYFAITMLAFAEIVRYTALAESRLTGGPIGTINLLGPGQTATYNDEWLAFHLARGATLKRSREPPRRLPGSRNGSPRAATAPRRSHSRSRGSASSSLGYRSSFLLSSDSSSEPVAFERPMKRSYDFSKKIRERACSRPIASSSQARPAL